jgi:hypothetical protein
MPHPVGKEKRRAHDGPRRFVLMQATIFQDCRVSFSSLLSPDP